MCTNNPDHISLVWCTEDVLSVRPKLTKDQARQVLATVLHRHDANYGVSWETLEITSDILFPDNQG